MIEREQSFSGNRVSPCHTGFIVLCSMDVGRTTNILVHCTSCVFVFVIAPCFVLGKLGTRFPNIGLRANGVQSEVDLTRQTDYSVNGTLRGDWMNQEKR